MSESDRTARAILLIQGVRAALYGFGAVIIGTSLAASGVGSVATGLLFGSMLVGMATGSLLAARLDARWGRAQVYAGLLLVMGAAGAVFAVTSWLPALFLAALTGTMSTDPNESGPITTVEQSMLSDVDDAVRVRTFGRYNAVAYLAGSAGALFAAVPGLVHGAGGRGVSAQLWLLAFPAGGLVTAWVARRRIGERESGPAAERAPRRLGPSRPAVRRLAAMFAVDAFAGGFIVQSFIAFWFERRYGISVSAIGAVFFAVGLLQAASSVVAARLGHRFGLLNTMVFTHLPSNALLMAVPLMPNVASAVAVLLARSALSQMDVPTRQAFVADLVAPEERTAAAAYTNAARYVVRPFGPVIAGAVMTLAIGAPFVIAGAVKIVYDGVLYRSFRRVQTRTHSTRNHRV